MKEPDPHSLKLSLFALPSQTTVLFALIVGVILIAVLSGAIGPSPFCVTPVLLGIVLLPLRAYLAWPEREIARYALHPAGESYTSLQAEIAALSAQIGITTYPRLMITDRPIGVYTFGSFRRRYVGMGTASAQSLTTDLASPTTVPRARAFLLHELAHFKNGDIWQMGYSRELLRTVAVFLVWTATFSVGLILLMMISVPAYLNADLSQAPGLDPNLRSQLELLLHLDPASRAEIAQKASQINLGLIASFVLNSLCPMIVTGVLVWVFYWRKLLRVRELYADARAAQALGDMLVVQKALGYYGVDYGRMELRLPVLRPSPTLPPASDTPMAFGGETGAALLRLHPRLKERIEYLQDPGRIFGAWWHTALVVGILVLLLDVLLVSPFTSYYLSSFPIHFATLSAFIAIAVSLLPGVVQGRRLGGDIVCIVIAVIAIRVGWLAFNLGLAAALYIISPDVLTDVLEIMVRTVARSAAFPSGPVIQDAGAALVEAGVGQLIFQVVMGLALLVFLYADVRLKQRVLTWYACKRVIVVCWIIIGWLAFVLGTLVLIPLTALIMSDPEALFNPISLSLMAVAVVAVVAGAGAYVWADRHYRQRCPKCGADAPDHFDRLGKNCFQCGEVFHPWLIANY
jgi:Zn-dependent protease with chaperone function